MLCNEGADGEVHQLGPMILDVRIDDNARWRIDSS
jgi:hypothetical protein